ncbi:hypothetical protein CAEBREN_23602 [Caenorhabditis brenneri]|uniref:ATP-dependent DNA helicase n=1 Tax=Caenorhabditis brenneri TaxID=135651 RepID=G0NGK9_CAEBE|nr:hypothetical protein CAEBREN_23602 [Caenorhabditis brenneri]
MIFAAASHSRTPHRFLNRPTEITLHSSQKKIRVEFRKRLETALPNEEDAFCEMSHITYAILRRTLAKARVLFVEECSMDSGLLFAQTDAQLQLVRGNSKPFGGLPVLLFGDLLQLPPVSGNAIYQEVPEQFKAPWESVCPRSNKNLWGLYRMLKLHHNGRTSDEDEARILMEIREERLSEESQRFLRMWCRMSNTTDKGIFEELEWMKKMDPGKTFAIIAPRNETVNRLIDFAIRRMKGVKEVRWQHVKNSEEELAYTAISRARSLKLCRLSCMNLEKWNQSSESKKVYLEKMKRKLPAS